MEFGKLVVLVLINICVEVNFHCIFVLLFYIHHQTRVVVTQLPNFLFVFSNLVVQHRNMFLQLLFLIHSFLDLIVQVLHLLCLQSYHLVRLHILRLQTGHLVRKLLQPLGLIPQHIFLTNQIQSQLLYETSSIRVGLQLYFHRLNLLFFVLQFSLQFHQLVQSTRVALHFGLQTLILLLLLC